MGFQYSVQTLSRFHAEGKVPIPMIYLFVELEMNNKRVVTFLLHLLHHMITQFCIFGTSLWRI